VKEEAKNLTKRAKRFSRTLPELLRRRTQFSLSSDNSNRDTRRLTRETQKEMERLQDKRAWQELFKAELTERVWTGALLDPNT
jgi:hypothetical protein